MRHQEHFPFGMPSSYWESKHESPAEERFADKGVLQSLTPLVQQALFEGMEAFFITFSKCLFKQMIKKFFD